MKNRLYTTLLVFLFILALQSYTNFITGQELLTAVKKDISYLADDRLEGRAIGTEGEKLAAQYIAEAFEKIGLTPKGTDGYMQEFTVKKSSNPHEKDIIGTNGEGATGRNVVGFINNKASYTIVIGAHFDHLGYGGQGSLHRGEKAIHNGADDNASGTTAIIQLSRLLKDKKSSYNYLFLAFSGEENGLWGSNYFSKNPTIDLNTVNFMLNLDMVGRLNAEKTLAINGTGTSPDWEEMLKKANTDNLKLVTSASGIGPSDHTSFYLQDIPVLHFFTGQHEDYHRPSDDPEKLNYEGIVKIIRYIERLITVSEEKEKLVFTKTQEEKNDNPRFTVTLGVVPDYLYDGQGMRIDGVSDGKPAAQAGMKKGDIVIQLGDSSITDMMGYMRALSSFKKGDQTTVHFKRNGETKSALITFK